MARQTLSAQALTVGGWPSDRVTITMTSENGDGAGFVNTGKEFILVRNGDGANQTVTVDAVADASGRTVNLTTSNIAAGAMATIGPFNAEYPGWEQSNGQIYFEATDTDVAYAVIKCP